MSNSLTKDKWKTAELDRKVIAQPLFLSHMLKQFILPYHAVFPFISMDLLADLKGVIMTALESSTMIDLQIWTTKGSRFGQKRLYNLWLVSKTGWTLTLWAICLHDPEGLIYGVIGTDDKNVSRTRGHISLIFLPPFFSGFISLVKPVGHFPFLPFVNEQHYYPLH